MSKTNTIRKNGTVIEALPGLSFKVKLEDGTEALAALGGKLKLFRIKTLPGDKVTVEFSPCDQTRGRIVWRER